MSLASALSKAVHSLAASGKIPRLGSDAALLNFFALEEYDLYWFDCDEELVGPRRDCARGNARGRASGTSLATRPAALTDGLAALLL